MCDIDKDTTEARRKAYHEAGHVVAGLEVGKPFTKTTIDGLMGCGETDFGSDDSCLMHAEVSQKISIHKYDAIVAKAGYIAESKCSESDAKEAFSGCDVQQAMSHIESICGLCAKHTEGELHEECYNEAVRIVDEQWKAIREIANELISKTSLTRQECTEIWLKFRMPHG